MPQLLRGRKLRVTQMHHIICTFATALASTNPCVEGNAFYACTHPYPGGLFAGPFLPRCSLWSRMRGPLSVPIRRYRLL